MTSDYSLLPDALRIEFGLEYSGEFDHPLRVQVGWPDHSGQMQRYMQ